MQRPFSAQRHQIVLNKAPPLPLPLSLSFYYMLFLRVWYDGSKATAALTLPEQNRIAEEKYSSLILRLKSELLVASAKSIISQFFLLLIVVYEPELIVSQGFIPPPFPLQVEQFIIASLLHIKNPDDKLTASCLMSELHYCSFTQTLRLQICSSIRNIAKHTKR